MPQQPVGEAFYFGDLLVVFSEINVKVIPYATVSAISHVQRDDAVALAQEILRRFDVKAA